MADGTPREVFQRVEELKAVGLTVPETTELLCSSGRRRWTFLWTH